MLRALQNKTLAGLLALGLLTTAAAASDSPVLDRVLSRGQLKVGMSGDQAPFNMVDRGGAVIGLEADISRTLAAAMGVDLVIVRRAFGQLLPALESGAVDMVMSGVAITPQRSRTVSFVGPYMLSGKSILTKSEVLAGTEAAAEFNRAELKLVALRGSTSQQFVERNLPASQLTLVDDYEAGVQRVLDDQADAMVADMPICVLSVLRYPDAGLLTLDEPMTLEPIGIAVNRADPQFQNLVGNYMNAFERTGVLDMMRQKWLEDGSWIAALP